MPPHYEDAAQLLKMLTARGLILTDRFSVHDTIMLLAGQIARHRQEGTSQAETASLTLFNLMLYGRASWDWMRQGELLGAIIGTTLGNIDARTRCARS
jgi:hypothetical protein